ncbi:hypothetical protein RUM44_003735 [Polyplax serrata]|uniref:PH domain-containing protein n=1 Tax=Polyplax serrata TaxID=468196 RepID=A0ABR1AIZ5_POLSC
MEQFSMVEVDSWPMYKVSIEVFRTVTVVLLLISIFRLVKSVTLLYQPHTWRLCSGQANALPGHVIQKGLLWQQRDKLFARWKERYFILTRDYLHCFRKATDNGFDRISDMGLFIFKIKLVDVERVTWINKKTYSAIALDFGRDGRILLRSQRGLEDWFDSLEECTMASKERRRALKCSRDSYQGENEQNMNSMSSNVEDWLVARKKIAQLQRDYISDSVPDISKLGPPSLRNLINSESRSKDDEERWYNAPFNAANQRLSLLTDIDINALDSSPPSIRLRATPTPCRLNSDIFFLPGLSGGARQRSSIAGAVVQVPETNQETGRPRLGTNGSEYKSRNFLGSFRIPNMLQTTRGTANRYSLIDDTNSLKVIYSTYEKKPISS